MLTALLAPFILPDLPHNTKNSTQCDEPREHNGNNHTALAAREHTS